MKYKDFFFLTFSWIFFVPVGIASFFLILIMYLLKMRKTTFLILNLRILYFLQLPIKRCQTDS